MRDKWDERRGASTYGMLTIERACTGVGDTYKSPVNRKSQASDSARKRPQDQRDDTTPPEDNIDGAAKIHMSGSRSRSSVTESDLFSSIAPYPAPIAPEGYYGMVGEFVRLVEPHTEADPNLLLISFLVYAGNCIRPQSTRMGKRGHTPHEPVRLRSGTNINGQERYGSRASRHILP